MMLKIEGLTKRFGEKLLLDGFSYEFPEKGVFALVGESGAGKTTLIRLIAGLDRKYGGSIIGGGAQEVSCCFQEYRLFPALNMLDNVLAALEAPTEADEARAKEILLSMGLSEGDTKLFPDELSGGMKQRTSLARAFLKDAPTLLLDEPTKELDRENLLSVLELIKKESEKRLVILATHRTEDIDHLGATVIEL